VLPLLLDLSMAKRRVSFNAEPVDGEDSDAELASVVQRVASLHRKKRGAATQKEEKLVAESNARIDILVRTAASDLAKSRMEAGQSVLARLAEQSAAHSAARKRLRDLSTAFVSDIEAARKRLKAQTKAVEEEAARVRARAQEAHVMDLQRVADLHVAVRGDMARLKESIAAIATGPNKQKLLQVAKAFE